MPKSILLIGNTISKSSLRLQGEAKKMGIILDTVSRENITLEEGVIKTVQTDLSYDVLDYDTYFFRGMGEKAKELQILASFLGSQNKRVVERCFVDDLLPVDKHVPLSRTGLYEVPPSRLVAYRNLETEIASVSFPIVGKKLDSSMGKGVVRIDTPEQLAQFAERVRGDFLLQKYFEISFDTRVFVVGGEVLGGFHRYKKEGENFLTTARGGERHRAELKEAEIAAAKEAIIYIIEVNASPQFSMFERIVGVNVAEKILNYIV